MLTIQGDNARFNEYAKQQRSILYSPHEPLTRRHSLQGTTVRRITQRQRQRSMAYNHIRDIAVYHRRYGQNPPETTREGAQNVTSVELVRHVYGRWSRQTL